MSAHIPDEELSLFAFDPGAFSQQRRAEIEGHTADCAQCGASFDFYMVTEEDLRDPLVWQPLDTPVPPMMSEYARRCVAENAEADRLLEPYLENAAKAAWDDISNRREFQTGGVVRRLNAHAHAIVASEPLAALTFADLAQAIASVLPDHVYPGNNVYEMRGTAWKERANALLRLGEFDEALESLRRAERDYRCLTSSRHGLAAVELVRAATYYQRGDLKTAAKHAESAEHDFTILGLTHQGIKALHLRASINLELLELDTATKLYQRVIDYGEELNDAEWVAKGSYGRANSELDRGNLGEASTLFTRALAILRETGPAADLISTEWGLARVMLHGGKASEALSRLREVSDAFERLGMVTDAALVGLDMADALLVLDLPQQITKLAEHSFRVLKKAGVLTGALAALAYMKETAARGRLDASAIRGIRAFLHQSERNPELSFVPPPFFR